MSLLRSSDIDLWELFLATSEHIAFGDGWTKEALKKGCTDCKIPYGHALLYFPTPEKDLLLFFHRTLDNQLIHHIQEDKTPLPHKLRDKIAFLTHYRLSLMDPFKDIVIKSLSKLCLPHTLLDQHDIYGPTVNTFWNLAGDRSLDIAYYTKRLSMSGIYMSSLLFWIHDTSPQAEETHAFIQRQIDRLFATFKTKDKIIEKAKQTVSLCLPF